MTTGPLDGIKVLDLTRLLPGPLATMIMGDLGADVIKIEDPQIGDMTRWFPPFRGDEGTLFSLLNRNKRSLTLDLKSSKGKDVFIRLVEKTDVIIESFRPGTVKRLGIDYETLKKVNDKVIYASISGYGQTGPYKDLPGHDINFIGLGGVLRSFEKKDGKYFIPPIQVADIGGGTLPALIAIFAALYNREKKGEGQYIDISMVDNLTLWFPILLAYLMAGEQIPKPGEAPLTGGLAGYYVYETKDDFITIGALEPHFWKGLCEGLGRLDFIERHQDGLQSQKEMQFEFQKIFLERTTNEWLDLLKNQGVCCGPVKKLNEIPNDQQIQSRNIFPNDSGTNAETEWQIGLPWKFSKSKPSIRVSPPQLGEHNNEILQELGLSEEEIANFKN